ncbi:MAG: S41 family peptidase [Bacteroidetes bacterium]|nr:S41 family peptidase [Bacteroidota bacterium]
MIKNKILSNAVKSVFPVVILILFSVSVSGQNNKQDLSGVRKYNALMQMIKFAYVDTVNESKLVEKAIVETLKELDPHSMYISKKDLKQANEQLVGNFEGIGVQFEILRDTINIVHPIPGGPSERLGILSGDKIVKIESENVTGKKVTNQFVFDRLRGKKGTKVNVTIFRSGRKDLLDFAIVRDKIPINSIDASYMIEPGIGYINLTRFSSTSMNELTDAILKLKAQGLQDLILDLRNNGGGYMNTAIELSDEFLSGRKLIVYTEGRMSPREEYFSTDKGLFEKGKVVIMINENSASASEIVSGAIQDLDRGIIVGRRSFGKGLVQRPFQLPDSSEVRLTTARYYTPSGRCIQKSYSEGVDKYYEDYSTRYKHGEMENSDSIKFPDSLKFHTTNGRVVYGGGGIMPDVFIPLDTTPFTDYFLNIRRKNVINLYVGDYVDKNRKDLQKKYPDFDTFDKKFTVDDAFIKDFLALAEKQGVKMEEKQYALSESLIKSQIKSLIAQKLWDVNESYKIINREDHEVQKAISVIKDNGLFDKFGIRH